MSTPAKTDGRIRFGIFEVDLAAGELWKSDRKIRIQEQPFRILVLLLERPGEIVSREYIIQRLWPDGTFVDYEDSVNTAIRKLREALCDDPDSPRFVETIPRRGYRFIAGLETPENIQSGTLEAKKTEAVGHKINFFHRWRLPLVLCLFAASVFALLVLQKSFTTSASNIKSIAVLPFTNLSGDPSQDYFADAMTEELTSDLGHIAALRVISRTSAMHYKKTPKTTPEIAQELNVDGVIEGSVLRSGDRVRITAQLINARSDRHLWSKIYDRDSQDVLVMQSELAQAIASEIKIWVSPQEQQHLSSAHAINPDAYDSYLLGNYHASKRNSAAMEKAIEYFQKAIRVDPGYAQAYAGLASAYLERDIWDGLGIGKSADQVRANTLKALELDGQLAEAHSLLGDIYFEYDWDWAHSEAEFKRAIELNSNFPRSYERYAFLLQTMGRNREAIAAAHHAVELDPLSAWYISEEGRILYRARRYQDAISRYQRALELDPDYLPVSWRMAEAYEQLGKYDEALVWARKYQQVTAVHPFLLLRARMNARMGKRREALEDLRSYETSSEGGNEDLLASVYAALGDHDRAIAELEKLVRDRSQLPFVFVDPQLDPLRSDPRFNELLHRVHLR